MALAADLDVLIARVAQGKKYRYPLTFPSQLQDREEEYYELVQQQQQQHLPSPKSTPENRFHQHETGSGEDAASDDEVTEFLRNINADKARAQVLLDQHNNFLGQLRHLSTATTMVQRQSDHLSANASALLAQKAHLEREAAQVGDVLKQFAAIDSVYREVHHPLLHATSGRFPALLDEIDTLLQYVSAPPVVDYHSSQGFACRLAAAQQKGCQVLRDALNSYLERASSAVISSEQYANIFFDKTLIPFTGSTNMRGAQTTSHPPVPTIGTDTADEPLIAAADTPELGATLNNLAFLFENKCNGYIGNNSSSNSSSGIGGATREGDSAKITGSGTALRRLFEARCSNVFAKLASSSTALISTETGFTEGEGDTSGSLGAASSVAPFEEALYNDVMSAYRRGRLAVLAPLLRDYIAAVARRQSAVATGMKMSPHTAHSASSSCLLWVFADTILDVLECVQSAEQRLFDRLWIIAPPVAMAYESGANSGTSSGVVAQAAMAPLLRELCEVLYQFYRSQLVQTDDLEAVTEACERLLRAREEMPEGEDRGSRLLSGPQSFFGSTNSSVSVTEEFILRMLRDTQERVVFRAGSYLRMQLARHRTSPEELKQLVRLNHNNDNNHASEEDNDKLPEENAELASTTPTVLRKCLHFLRVLYPVVDIHVFAMYAQDCVMHALRGLQVVESGMRGLPVGILSATAALAEAPERVSSSEGELPPSPALVALHARLCHLCSLLQLRERLGRYDDALGTGEDGRGVVMEKSLQLDKLLVVQSAHDVRRDVDQQLVGVCDATVKVMDEVVNNIVQRGTEGTEEERRTLAISAVSNVLSAYVSAPATRTVLLNRIGASSQ